MLATDGGGLITQAPVSIEVIRNTPPSITNNLLSVEIFNNHTLNSDVFDVQYFDPDIDVSDCLLFSPVLKLCFCEKKTYKMYIKSYCINVVVMVINNS